MLLASWNIRYRSSTSDNGSVQSIAGRSVKDDELNKLKEQKNRFPIADYDEPDSNDAQKDRLRKEKQKRHNDFKIVTSKPPEWQAERVFVGEGAMNFPALPVAESSYILLGRVTNAEAHLSENKKNVYSEFTISVEKVFKTADSSIIVGNEIVVDRIGGYVKCPNGRTLLYRVASTNMPAVNERYLLFLTSKNDQDFSILTAYALKSDGVSPLDDSPQLNSCGVSRKRLSYKSFEIPFHLLISPNTSCANDIVLQIIDSGH